LIEHNVLKASSGYTLLTPIANGHQTSYLLNMDGQVVHQWELSGFRGGCSKLLPNGNLLTTLRADIEIKPSREEPRVIRELDGGGDTVWECKATANIIIFIVEPMVLPFTLDLSGYAPRTLLGSKVEFQDLRCPVATF
jgi:hypothetical protein